MKKGGRSLEHQLTLAQRRIDRHDRVLARALKKRLESEARQATVKAQMDVASQAARKSPRIYT